MNTTAATERAPARRPRPDGGFTLVEVLVALLILAVGLLALEALGIGAAKMVGKARRQSAYTAMATSELERVTGMIRDNRTVTNANQALAGGGTMATQVVQSGTLFTVTVTVTPPSTRAVVERNGVIRLSANVFRPF